jgi:hypothetical protein
MNASSKLPNHRRCEPDVLAPRTPVGSVGARMRQRRFGELAHSSRAGPKSPGQRVCPARLALARAGAPARAVRLPLRLSAGRGQRSLPDGRNGPCCASAQSLGACRSSATRQHGVGARPTHSAGLETASAPSLTRRSRPPFRRARKTAGLGRRTGRCDPIPATRLSRRTGHPPPISNLRPFHAQIHTAAHSRRDSWRHNYLVTIGPGV